MIEIRIRDDRRAFRPGETVTGEATWALDRPPQSVELRLFWFTRGRGTGDVDIVKIVNFESPHQHDSRRFEVLLPESPHSFSGKLISLTWAIEVVAKPGETAARNEFVVSPSLAEIVLHP